VDEAERIEPAIASSPAGTPPIDEISVVPLPSVHTWRRCVVGIKRNDEVVALEPDPWPE
jgi:hypothetical protein